MESKSNKTKNYFDENKDQEKQQEDPNEKTVILESNITKNLESFKEMKILKEELKKSNGYLQILECLEPIVLLTYILSFIAISFIFFNSNIENTVLTKLKTNMGLPTNSNTRRLNDNRYISKMIEELIFNVTLSDFVIAEKYYIVSGLRTSIKVYKETEGKNSFILGKTTGKREKSKLSPFEYFNNLAERNDTINDYYNEYQIDNSFLGNGGYVLHFNKSALTKLENKNNYDKSIKHYYRNPTQFSPGVVNFTKAMNKTLVDNYLLNNDVDIGCLTFDFVLMNLEAGYFIPFYLYFDINSAKVVRYYFEFNLIKLNIYGGRLNTLRLVCEITFIISVVIYFFIFISKTIIKANETYRELFFKERKKVEKAELEQFIKRKKSENKEIYSKKMKELEIIQKNMKSSKDKYTLNIKKNKIDSQIKYEFKLSLKDSAVREKIDINVKENTEKVPVICIKLLLSEYIFISISVLLSILCIIYWLIFIISHKQIINDYSSKFEILVRNFDSLKANKMFELVNTLKSLKLVVILNFLVLFIRIFTYVKTIIRELNIFSICFNYALNHIISFFIIFITFCLGVAVLCYFLYFQVYAFHEFLTTFMSIVGFSVLEIDEISYLEMASENKVMTILITIFNIIFLKFIVTRIILSIILFSYSLAFDNYESENKTQLMIQGKTSDEIVAYFRTFIYKFIVGVSDGIVQIINFILCIKKSSKNKIEEKIELSVRNSISLRQQLCSLRKNYKLDNIIGNSPNFDEAITILKREHIGPNSNLGSKTLFKNEDKKQNDNEPDNNNFNNDEDVSSMNMKKNENLKTNTENLLSQDKKYLTTTNLKTDDISNNLPRDILSIESEFDENTYNNQRSIYFDSEKDTFLVNSANEKKFRNKINLMLLFIMLVIFAIISMFYSNFNSQKFKMNQSIIYFIENFEIPDKVNYHNVINNYNLKEYVFDVFPKMFKKDGKFFTLLNENILMHNSTLLTVKRSKKLNASEDEYYQSNFVENSNPNFTFNNPLYIRDFTYTLMMENFRNENKTSTKIDNDLYLDYCVNRSYKKFGGYCINYGPKGFNKYSLPYKYENALTNTTKFLLKDNHSKAIIDEYTNYVILENYLYNFETEIATQLTITFTITEGGKIEKKILPFMIKKNSSNTVTIVNYVFDIIFVVTLIFYILNTFNEINITYNQYDHWESHFLNNISPKANELRQQIENEVIRKFKSMLRIDIILNLIIVVICIFYIVYRIVIIIDATKFNSIISNYIYTEDDLKFNLQEGISNNIYLIQTNFSKYIKNIKGLNYSSILFLLTTSLKFLFVIDFGKYFGLVVKTITEASSQLIVFLIALLLTQPAFICYSYIFYGKDLDEYSTWINTTLITLISMFGKYDILSTYLIEKNLSALHFFLYVFIINLILINLFLSILDKAYIKTKVELKKIADEYESVYVFFFCFYKRKEIYNNIKKKLENEFDYLKIKQSYKFDIPEINDSKIGAKFFSDLEVKHLSEVSEVLHFKINQIYSFESNLNSVIKGINDSKVKENKELSNKYLSSYRMLILNYMNRINSSLELNILDIENRYKHLVMYSKYIDFKDKTESLIFMNEEKLVSIAEFENCIKNLLWEIEKYRKVILELDNLEKDINLEFINNIMNMKEEERDNDNENENENNESVLDNEKLMLSKKQTSNYFLSTINVNANQNSNQGHGTSKQKNTLNDEDTKKETDISKSQVKGNVNLFTTKETKES